MNQHTDIEKLEQMAEDGHGALMNVLFAISDLAEHGEYADVIGHLHEVAEEGIYDQNQSTRN